MDKIYKGQTHCFVLKTCYRVIVYDVLDYRKHCVCTCVHISMHEQEKCALGKSLDNFTLVSSYYCYP